MSVQSVSLIGVMCRRGQFPYRKTSVSAINLPLGWHMSVVSLSMGCHFAVQSLHVTR